MFCLNKNKRKFKIKCYFIIWFNNVMLAYEH
jgi:hypothetical protein